VLTCAISSTSFAKLLQLSSSFTSTLAWAFRSWCYKPHQQAEAYCLSVLQDTKLARNDLAIHMKAASIKQTTSLFQLKYSRTITMADQQSAPRSDKAYAVSPADAPIPYTDEEAANAFRDQDPVDANSLAAAFEQLHALIAQVDASTEFADQVKQAEVSWSAAVSSLDRQTQDLVAVFEECVFPNNRHTRKRGDYHGSSLHLPGLIKAVSTDFNYKKYFSSKTAGGRKEYSICLVVDTSLSMHGQLAQATVDALVTIICALGQLELESYSILLFGETVRLIKSSDMPWSRAAIYVLLKQLSFETEFATLDADAIQCALALLNSSTVRGPKKIFVLTDGYGSCGARLAQVKNGPKCICPDLTLY
jgi:hypothetical protein